MLCYYNTAKELETNKKHYLYAKTLLCLLQILHSQFYDSKRVFTRLKYNAHVSTCVRPPSLHPSVSFALTLEFKSWSNQFCASLDGEAVIVSLNPLIR